MNKTLKNIRIKFRITSNKVPSFPIPAKITEKYNKLINNIPCQDLEIPPNYSVFEND
jgi:hypothetical protein